jgi:hypothetical protein
MELAQSVCSRIILFVLLSTIAALPVPDNPRVTYTGDDSTSVPQGRVIYYPSEGGGVKPVIDVETEPEKAYPEDPCGKKLLENNDFNAYLECRKKFQNHQNHHHY